MEISENRDDIQQLIENSSEAELMQKHSKRELTEMYNSIFGFYPMSGYKSKDIIQGMKNYYYTIRRAESFTELQRNK